MVNMAVECLDLLVMSGVQNRTVYAYDSYVARERTQAYVMLTILVLNR